jgi:hypothetical protein
MLIDRRLIVPCALAICALLGVLGAPLHAAKPSPQVGLIVKTLSPGLAADLELAAGNPGVVVMGIMAGSPAAAADIHEGDLIVRLQIGGGKPFPVADQDFFMAAIGKSSVNKPVVLTLLRNGAQVPVQISPGAGPFDRPVQPEAAAEPRTIKVAADGSGDCRSIDGAMLRAKPGDTIAVGGGRYPAVSVVRDRLTLAAADPKDPAVVAGVWFGGVTGARVKDLAVSSESSGSGAGVSGAGGGLVVDGCLVRGFAYGIALSGQDLTVTGCTLTENDWAVYGLTGDSSWKVLRNLVFKNSGGLWLAGQSDISNNTIVENRLPAAEFLKRLYKSGLTAGTGVELVVRGSRAVLYNNIIASNSIGVLVDPSVQATIEYNDFFMNTLEPATIKTGWALNDNHADLQAANSNLLSQIARSTQKIRGNLIDTFTPQLLFTPSQTNISADPLFVDPMKGNYRLAADSPLLGRGRGKDDIGAFPAAAAAGESGDRRASFGISARPLAESDLQTPGLTALKGLWVTEVKKGGLAEGLQVKVDDIILSVNGQAFDDADGFRKLVADGKVDKVEVLRAGKRVILVKPTDY